MGGGTIFDKTTKHAVIILRLKLVYSFDIENVCNSLGTAFGGKLQLGPLGGGGGGSFPCAPPKMKPCLYTD